MIDLALIPAKGHSERVPGKNLLELGGHPLVGLAIAGALQSEVFEEVICATDSDQIAEVAMSYGAKIFEREESYPEEQDIEWLDPCLRANSPRRDTGVTFAVLRPTNPFRLPATIQRAEKWFTRADARYLRAVSKVSEHPYKMWEVKIGEDRMVPLIEESYRGRPAFSMPYQKLPRIYVQNGCIEIGHVYDVLAHGIPSEDIAPFYTMGYESLDLNREEDWWVAQRAYDFGYDRLVMADTHRLGRFRDVA